MSDITIQDSIRNRLASHERGLKKYQGRPCLYGHPGIRRVRNNQCVDCDRAKRHESRSGQRPGRGAYAPKGEEARKVRVIKLPIRTPAGMAPLTAADLMAGSANRR